MGKKKPRRKAAAPGRSAEPSLSGLPCPPLLAWLRSQITADELTALASLDYMTDVPQHRAALQRIANGDLTALDPLDWHPKEVLELSRWDEGGGFTDSRHRRRLFATTILLVAAAVPKNHDRMHSVNETVVVAVESVIEAFPDHADELVQVIDLLTERWRDDDERPHLLLARLLLRRIAGAPPDELAAIVEAADQLATSVRAQPHFMWGPVKGPYGWIMDLTIFHPRRRLWRRLLDEALEALRSRPDAALAAERLATLRDRAE